MGSELKGSKNLKSLKVWGKFKFLTYLKTTNLNINVEKKIYFRFLVSYSFPKFQKTNKMFNNFQITKSLVYLL